VDQDTVGTAMMQLVWDAASSPADGEDVSGDAYVVRSAADGYVLAVADGLGHGPEATLAANAAIAAATHPGEDSPSVLLRRSHEACSYTRGVVMTVVHVDTRRNEVCWAGVGNVEAVLVRNRLSGQSRRETAMLPGGVVGVALPPLKEQTYEIEPGDVLALATDGIRGEFVSELMTLAAPSSMTARIIDRHRLKADDALVLIARCEAVR
jgi:serine phosphatase RsbU (regulator of sigma subunit)